MNQIFHYRLDGTHNECGADEPWSKCLFNNETDFAPYKTAPLLSIAGQPVIKQHHATYITGRDTCHAHHFAKMIAGAIISGFYSHAPSVAIHPRQSAPPCNGAPTSDTVLWIDTVHSPHACAQLYHEMKDNFHFQEGQFQLMCLDMLGVFREDFYLLIGEIEANIRQFRPKLIVIDDIDHFLPYCGVTIASHFFHIFRDTLNHTESAFLFIGYNHLGKRASTTGNVGKSLFPSSDCVFSVTTQHGISHVRLVRSLDTRSIPEAEFIFSIGDDNMPHELVKTTSAGAISPSVIEHTTLNDIITGVIEPGETLVPDELVTRISMRNAQLNRINQARTIIAKATSFGIIRKDVNGYILTTSKIGNVVNNLLTLPPHPSGPSSSPNAPNESTLPSQSLP